MDIPVILSILPITISTRVTPTIATIRNATPSPTSSRFINVSLGGAEKIKNQCLEQITPMTMLSHGHQNKTTVLL
jgi:hypothetical protein